MTNQYQTLKDRQQKEFNAFPMGAAFNKQQFAEMMVKLGLLPTDTDKIVSIGSGCYIRKTDREALRELIGRLDAEQQKAIADDETGDGFIFDMFLYELGNHEYCITHELEDTLNALCLTIEEINADSRLLHGLNKAIKVYMENCKNY